MAAHSVQSSNSPPDIQKFNFQNQLKKQKKFQPLRVFRNALYVPAVLKGISFLFSEKASKKERKNYPESYKLIYIGLKQTYISVGYPQSNGKIERFFKTAKEECIRRNSFLSLYDARRIIDRYIEQYNYERLHSAIDYITPYDMLIGRKEQILEEREKKLENARRIREENIKSKSNLFGTPVLSNSR
jgi:hypothetical protein